MKNNTVDMNKSLCLLCLIVIVVFASCWGDKTVSDNPDTPIDTISNNNIVEEQPDTTQEETITIKDSISEETTDVKTKPSLVIETETDPKDEIRPTTTTTPSLEEPEATTPTTTTIPSNNTNLPQDEIVNEIKDIKDIKNTEVNNPTPPPPTTNPTPTPCNIPQSGSIKTFIIAGQSNAGSIGKANEIPDGYLDGTCTWLFYQSDRGIQELKPGVNTCPKDNCGTAGVEVSIAKELYEKYKEPILIFKYYKGGTALRENTKNIDWSTNSKGELFDRFRNNFKKLQGTYPNLNFDILGMAWIQGEKDASGGTKSNIYYNELNKLIETTRTFIGKNFPVSIVKLNIQHKAAHSKKQEIRKAQTRFVNSDENAFLIDVDDVKYDPAYIPHYTMAGYMEIGKRIAKKH